jgi:hypothetical protein
MTSLYRSVKRSLYRSVNRSHERTNERTNEEGGRLILSMTLSNARAKNGT